MQILVQLSLIWLLFEINHLLTYHGHGLEKKPNSMFGVHQLHYWIGKTFLRLHWFLPDAKARKKAQFQARQDSEAEADAEAERKAQLKAEIKAEIEADRAGKQQEREDKKKDQEKEKVEQIKQMRREKVKTVINNQ